MIGVVLVLVALVVVAVWRAYRSWPGSSQPRPPRGQRPPPRRADLRVRPPTGGGHLAPAVGVEHMPKVDDGPGPGGARFAPGLPAMSSLADYGHEAGNVEATFVEHVWPEPRMRDPHGIVGKRARFRTAVFGATGKVIAYMDKPCYLVQEDDGVKLVVLAEFFEGLAPPTGRCPTHRLTYCEECGWV